MYMFRKEIMNACDWSHGNEESKRSLMTSLTRLFCGPWWSAEGRSFSRIRRSGSPWCDWELRQSMNFRWSHASWWHLRSVGLKQRVLRGMAKAPCIPSNIDLNRAVEGTHSRLPNCLESIRSPTMGRGAQQRWQRTVSTRFLNGTDVVVSVAASPCCPIEMTCHQVHMLTNTARIVRISFFAISRSWRWCY